MIMQKHYPKIKATGIGSQKPDAVFLASLITPD